MVVLHSTHAQADGLHNVADGLVQVWEVVTFRVYMWALQPTFYGGLEGGVNTGVGTMIVAGR